MSVFDRVRRGASLAAIEATYRSRFADFARVATAITGDPSSGADVVQEAFVAAVQKRRAYRAEGDLEGWLWRIVVNTARNHRRTNTRHRLLDSVEEPGNLAPVDDDLLSALSSQIAGLPERQRLVIFLRYYADLDYERIARTLGVSGGTVASSLHAAHSTLREALRKDTAR